MTCSRLPPQPGELIDRETGLRFVWNGEPLTAFDGDTIASALLANGVRVVSRSMKYHRPRGYLTADYWDPNGFVQVGDDPNVRSGHRLVTDGMTVEAQNVWPSLDHDVKAANGLVGRFLTAGFYYKTFIRPRRLWPTFEKVLSTFAPGGMVDLDTPHRLHDKRYAHPDVVVAGGGPAGMAAAIAAAEAGASVMLVEHGHHLGGHLLWGDETQRRTAAELVKAVRAAGIEVLTDSTVTGRYEDNWIAVVQRNHPLAVERLIKARAKTLVVAPGLIERPYVFAGNDKPGVMLSGAVRRLINLYGVKPGIRAVVLTANTDGEAATADLERAGVEVARVVDTRDGGDVVEATGPARSVTEVRLNDGTTVDCDLLVTAIGWTAPTSLLNMAGDRPVYDAAAGRFFPGSEPGRATDTGTATDPGTAMNPGTAMDTVLSTGGLAGDGTVEQLIDHGHRTGLLAAARAAAVSHRVQAATARAVPVTTDEPRWPADDRVPLGRDDHPALFRSSTHGIVDFSEDVGSKDLIGAAAEGYDSVELLKRYTTATMGPAQGKLETVNTVAVLAEARGETIEEVGTTVWRPPLRPDNAGGAGRADLRTGQGLVHPTVA